MNPNGVNPDPSQNQNPNVTPVQPLTPFPENNTPNVETVNPVLTNFPTPQNQPSITNFPEPSQPTIKKTFHLPAWFDLLIVIGVIGATLIAIIIGVLSYKSTENAKHLKAIGKQGLGIVVSSNYQMTSQAHYGQVYQPAQYVTNVTYKLLNIPGYTTQTYQSSIDSQSSPEIIKAGTEVPVIYNSSNPGQNQLKESLDAASSSFLYIVAFMPLFFLVLSILAVYWWIRRMKIRHQAIERLQS